MHLAYIAFCFKIIDMLVVWKWTMLLYNILNVYCGNQFKDTSTARGHPYIWGDKLQSVTLYKKNRKSTVKHHFDKWPFIYQLNKANIARVWNCPDITISNNLFVFLLFLFQMLYGEVIFLDLVFKQYSFVHSSCLPFCLVFFLFFAFFVFMSFCLFF